MKLNLIFFYGLGLDPAVPGINFDPQTTLDVSDAKTVEIYFTSVLSYGHPLGDLNFIFNGGLEQPDCDDCLFQSWFDSDRFSVYNFHDR